MATTTNYGWTTPDDTALVKDGAAAIRTLGSSIDTSVKALSPGTTSGDLDYYTAATTKARLGIGSTGQILTVAGGVPSWATATAAGTNWSLVNAGGTALTGATTITVSGITSADKLMVVVAGASSVNVASYFTLRINADSGTNYNQFGLENTGSATYSTGVFAIKNSSSVTDLAFGRMEGGSANAVVAGYCYITGGNAAGPKMFNIAVGASNPSGNSQMQNATGGYWTGSATISSVSIISSTGNFDAGTIFVYKSA
jgi:hypothetical protein